MFFSSVLSDLKQAGKLFQQPADNVTRTRGWIWRRRCSVGESASVQQMKQTSHHKLWRRSADMADSESDDEHSTARSTNTYIHRQSIPPLVTELTTSWLQTVTATASECAQDDKLSVVEIIVLLLTIIKHIVYQDIKSAKELSPSTFLVPNIANTFRDIIWQLSSTDCRSVKAVTEMDLIIIGRCLVRVFFLSLLQIAEQNNGLTWLQHCKHIEESIDCVSESLNTLSRDVKRRLLLIDYVVCCWLYVEGLLLRHHANSIVIGAVCRTADLITRHRGLDLTRSVLLRISEENSGQDLNESLTVVHLLKQIVAVSRLLKLMRSRYVHCCTCSRRTHRHCNVTSHRSIYRHHHDALGVAVQSPYQLHTNTASRWLPVYSTLTNTCIVSSLAIFLLGVFHHLVDTHVQMYLLDIFDKGVVTCCCLPVDLLVATFVSDELSPGLLKKSLTVLVNVLLNDCGGNATLDHCTVCDDALKLSTVCDDALKVASVCDDMLMMRNVAELKASAHSGCEVLRSSSVCRWKCVSEFAEILCTGDSTFTIYVISQAARLASSGNESLKQQLYCGLFMPLLVTLVHQLIPYSYSDGGMLTTVLSADTVPLAVQLSLSALSTILASSSLLRQFVNTRGIDMICKLADVNTTRHSALSLLEVLVNVESSRAERRKTLHAGHDVADDDVTNVNALDAFVQQLFLDCDDAPCNEKLRANLKSSDYQVGRMSDLWHVACRLLAHNGLFRERFVQLNGPQLAYLLLVAASETFLALDCGMSTIDMRVAVFYGRDDEAHVHECSLLLFIRSTLSICLQCSNLDVGIPQQVNTFLTDCTVHLSASK